MSGQKQKQLESWPPACFEATRSIVHPSKIAMQSVVELFPLDGQGATKHSACKGWIDEICVPMGHKLRPMCNFIRMI